MIVSAFMTLFAILEPRCDLAVIQLLKFLAVVKVVVTISIWAASFGIGLTLGLCLALWHRLYHKRRG